jgi:hypothetical protein
VPQVVVLQLLARHLSFCLCPEVGSRWRSRMFNGSFADKILENAAIGVMP